MKWLLVLGLATLSLASVSAQTPIALPDPQGVTRTLAAFKGKVVLVDFWASWCPPCRKANPELVAIYSQFKTKGFEIFGVSIDEDRAAWKKAIAQDKLPWTQVIESGWDGPVASAWKLQQVPSSFLLDARGRVIARDLSPTQLRAKLIEMFKQSP